LPGPMFGVRPVRGVAGRGVAVEPKGDTQVCKAHTFEARRVGLDKSLPRERNRSGLGAKPAVNSARGRGSFSIPSCGCRKLGFPASAHSAGGDEGSGTREG
jgi:hypothetical protein